MYRVWHHSRQTLAWDGITSSESPYAWSLRLSAEKSCEPVLLRLRILHGKVPIVSLSMSILRREFSSSSKEPSASACLAQRSITVPDQSSSVMRTNRTAIDTEARAGFTCVLRLKTALSQHRCLRRRDTHASSRR